AAIRSSTTPHGEVLGSVPTLAKPNAANNVPSDATVIGSETALVEAFTRLKDWLAGNGLRVDAEPMGAWWKIQVSVGAERKPPAVPELGEPLVRLIVDTQLDGWLDARRTDGADIYLPAHRPR